MNKDDCNIFLSLKKEDFKKFRELSVNIILSTDGAFHFTDLAKLKARVSSGKNYILKNFDLFIYSLFLLILLDFDLKEKDKHFCIA